MVQTIEITGQRGVSLRTLIPSNALALAGIANDVAIAACIRDSFPSPYTVTNAQEFIQFATADNRLHAWGIFENDTLVGVISLTLQEDIYRHSAEIGYWLGTAFHGKKIITEAIALACQHGFNQLHIIRIFAHVFENNIASQKALLKNGFVLEGIRKKGAVKNKMLIDDYLMAKLK